MPSASSAQIRKYEPGDRQAVRNIFFDTAFLGEPADAFFSDKEIICDALTAYYTDYEPESCFVAVADSKVVGCLTGAKDKIRAEEITSAKIFPLLFSKALLRGVFFKTKNLVFILNIFSSLIKGEFKMPVSLRAFPAILHINISKAYRSLDIGSNLMAAYFSYLKEEQVPGVCLATMSKGASEFFAKAGFRLAYSGKRSYFRYLIQKDLPINIYVKSL
jgi:hypothetical protein